MRAAAWLWLAACTPAPSGALHAVDLPSAASAPNELPPAPAVEAKLPIERRTMGVGYSGRCLIEAGKVHCWGGSTGHVARAPLTVAVPSLGLPRPAVSLDVGGNHACVVLDDGTVHCWGDNSIGQLGAASPLERSDKPLPVADLDDAVAVAVGNRHSCVLRQGGRVSCWGDNRSGQSGHDTHYTGPARRLVRPVEVAELSGALALVAGETASCARDPKGQAWCWGTPFGPGGHGYEPRVKPQLLTGLGKLRTLASEDDYGCAVLADGRVQCWGYSYGDRLGHAGDRDAPVDGLSDASAVAVGSAHACARTSRGVTCWGTGRNGQLGRALDGHAESSLVAKLVTGLPADLGELALGESVSCVRSTTAISCWGRSPWQDGGPDVMHAESIALR